MAWLRDLLVAMLILSAAAAAQPAPPSPDGVEVSLSPSEVHVSVEEPATIQVRVRNTGTPTGTPLDQDRTILLEVSGAPSGWTASVAPSTLRLAPGENGTATLTVSVATESAEGSASLTVTAKLFPRGVNFIPGAGPTVDPEATATAALAAQRDDPLTRDILESIGPWIYVVVLALVAAVLLATRLTVVHRRVAVALECGQDTVTVPAGGRVSLPFTVQNVSKHEDNVAFQVSAVANGWAAFTPVPEIQIEAGGSQELSLVVIASKELVAGSRQSILVTATSAQAPHRPATLSLEAVVGDRRPGKAAA